MEYEVIIFVLEASPEQDLVSEALTKKSNEGWSIHSLIPYPDSQVDRLLAVFERKATAANPKGRIVPGR